MNLRKFVLNNVKRNVLILFNVLLFVCSISPMNGITANAATTTSGWEKAYKKMINNSELLDKYEDMSYIKNYFGDDYKFDKYFLYDINHNKVPELFLYSSTMGLTVVLTYSNNKIVYLFCDAISKINSIAGEIIVNGHWHGVGGSGEYEWSIYQVKKNTCSIEYYIDNLGGNYSVYNSDMKCISTKKSTYTKILTQHVNSKNCKDFKKIKKYNVSSNKGIKNYK